MGWIAMWGGVRFSTLVESRDKLRTRQETNMCGINGIYSTVTIPDRSLIKQMNDRIVHRGPDDEGCWYSENVHLGMRRLSIVDVEGGHQPMISSDGRLVLVFNGEIYNFQSLRNDLRRLGHSFKTRSDTEVVLHAYAQHGTSCFSLLEGMFALAIYDTKENQLILCRDRLGKKPVYYTVADGRFMFASELKSILAVSRARFTLNRVALAHFLQLSYIPAPHTIYEGVHKLGAGSFMRVKEDLAHEISRYWDLQTAIPTDLARDPTSAQKGLRDLLTDCVTKRMVADVPLGTLLSGGVDSSIITGIMARHSDRPVKTFSVANTVGSYDESAKARLVSGLFKTEHTEWVVNPEELHEHIYDVIDTFDEPFCDMAAIPFYIISKKAREHVKVVLTGDGGDEMFGGYTRYLVYRYAAMYKRIPAFLRNSLINPTLRAMPVPVSLGLAYNKLRKLATAAGGTEFDLYWSMVQLGYSEEDVARSFAATIPCGEVTNTVRKYHDALGANASAIRKAQFCDAVLGLEGQMLPKVDRASMLASLEVRCPFVDHRIAEFAFGLDDALKVDEKNRKLKLILKQSFADMFPEGFLEKPKMGFGIPMAAFLRKELAGDLHRSVSDSPLIESGLVNRDVVARTMQVHANGGDRTHLLWPYLVLARWFARNCGHLQT
jgi:asparagine synthase (glutamine-hydrolysing)